MNQFKQSNNKCFSFIFRTFFLQKKYLFLFGLLIIQIELSAQTPKSFTASEIGQQLNKLNFLGSG